MTGVVILQRRGGGGQQQQRQQLRRQHCHAGLPNSTHPPAHSPYSAHPTHPCRGPAVGHASLMVQGAPRQCCRQRWGCGVAGHHLLVGAVPFGTATQRDQGRRVIRDLQQQPTQRRVQRGQWTQRAWGIAPSLVCVGGPSPSLLCFLPGVLLLCERVGTGTAAKHRHQAVEEQLPTHDSPHRCPRWTAGQ